MITFIWLLTGAGSVAIVLFSELVWRSKKYSPEFVRKLIHVTSGLYIAFWPWWLSHDRIAAAAIIYFIALTSGRFFKPLARIFSIGKSSRELERITFGDFFFAAGFGAVALMTSNRYIFLIAILHLALADTVAAVVGRRHGQRNRYSVFGLQKSVAGSLAFLITSLVLMSVFVLLDGGSWTLLLWVPIVATLLENTGFNGSDNLFVPFGVALLLRLAS